MAAYELSTAPLAAFYQQRNLLVRVKADGAPATIFDRTMSMLRAR
jgi:hypothetical protein